MHPEQTTKNLTRFAIPSLIGGLVLIHKTVTDLSNGYIKVPFGYIDVTVHTQSFWLTSSSMMLASIALLTLASGGLYLLHKQRDQHQGA